MQETFKYVTPLSHSVLITCRKGKVMKIFSCTLLLIAILAFVLLGCSDSNSPVTPSEQALSTATSTTALAKGGVLASASGSGQMYIDENGKPAEKGDMMRVFTFNAREYADGCSGEVTFQVAPGRPLAFKGDVILLKVHGNKASIVFKYTEGEGFFAGLVGWVALMQVRDNGEGASALPDELAGFLSLNRPTIPPRWETSTPDEDTPALARFGYPLVPINMGNIQVRGESYPE
jgi:hypothetical protein